MNTVHTVQVDMESASFCNPFPSEQDILKSLPMPDPFDESVDDDIYLTDLVPDLHSEENDAM